MAIEAGENILVNRRGLQRALVTDTPAGVVVLLPNPAAPIRILRQILFMIVRSEEGSGCESWLPYRRSLSTGRLSVALTSVDRKTSEGPSPW